MNSLEFKAYLSSLNLFSLWHKFILISNDLMVGFELGVRVLIDYYLNSFPHALNTLFMINLMILGINCGSMVCFVIGVWVSSN